jgi:hypothetical protein
MQRGRRLAETRGSRPNDTSESSQKATESQQSGAPSSSQIESIIAPETSGELKFSRWLNTED